MTSDVKYVYTSAYATSALKNDGSVVSWGNGLYGADYNQLIVPNLTRVINIFSTARSNFALKDDGTIVGWGREGYGTDLSGVSLEPLKEFIPNRSGSNTSIIF